MKKFRFYSLLLLWLILLQAAPRAGAQSTLEKLRVTYSAIGGSQASVWIPYEAGIFRKHGLDVELLYVAGGGRAAQVVQSGEVPVGVFTGGAVINSHLAGGDVVNAELAIMARKEGFRELADIAKMGLNFPTSSIVTTRSFIKRNENTVRKFIRGFVEGVHHGKTQRAFSIQVMQKYLRSSDPAMSNDLYELYIVQNIPRIPRPSPEALKTVMQQMAETDPRVAKLSPEQFIDARFFQELDKEGFIQRLWK